MIYIIQSKYQAPLFIKVGEAEKILNPKSSIKVELDDARVQELKKQFGNKILIKQGA